MQNLTELRSVYAEDLAPGARNAIRTCLRIQPRERVVLVTDLETEEIAASLADQIRQVGASVDAHVMEDYGPRPMLSIPEPIRAGLERADVSIYAGQPKTGELAFRRALTEVVDRRQIRHAHMVSISRQIMCEAMRADFGEVDAISQRVHARAVKAKSIVAKSPGGFHIEATFDPEIRWLKTSGIIATSNWGNRPGGEVLTCPDRVDGEADDSRERFVGAGAPEGAALEHRRAGVNLERGHGHDRLLSARSRWLPRPTAAESSTGGSGLGVRRDSGP
jgi:leucyl aminopeptidase (aminopeptidase T)